MAAVIPIHLDIPRLELRTNLNEECLFGIGQFQRRNALPLWES